MADRTTIEHPTLGSVTGLRTGNVVSFRGLRYGTLSSRLAESERNTAAPPNGDATAYGPEPLQSPAACAIEWFLIGAKCPRESGVRQKWSGTECLNLNITAPVDPPKEGKLPVVVFIHGGANLQGASSWPQYNLTPLVTASVEFSLPVVAVSINYRTNVYGFLHIPGQPANRGLHDQLTALAWIRANITGFAGDPENITLVGHSAGAAAIAFHIEAGVPGVKRAVMMSGDPGIMPVFPEGTRAATLKRACDALSVPPDQIVGYLQSAPQGELYDRLPEDLMYRPVTPLPTGSGDKLTALMVGDTSHDGGILASLSTGPASEGLAEKLCKYFSILPESFGQLYNLQPTLSPLEARSRLLDILTDWGFSVSAVAAARESKVPTYLYHFNRENPWPASLTNPWAGQANHILDVAHLLGNYPQLEGSSAVGAAMRKAVLTFAAGREPWEKYAENKQVVVFEDGEGSGKRVTVTGDDDRRERAAGWWKVVDEAGGLEKVRGAVMGVLRTL